ncbi:MAG: anaerobic ribonucleoside-triphosphate reductase activating protein [Clostridia bacterium]|nr:anaerobic ribonucleoside-triphosphate reductase activating protein [Clostridia bacterium]
MLINGLQKLTLLDYPGRMACTVFLAGCDLRCPYCHNSELWEASAPAVMTDEELLRFLETRKGVLEGVAFTGGEALLRPGLGELMKKIKDMGFLVKLDTNGTHPKRLRELIEAGLIDYCAMDIKNDLSRYGLTCGREDMDTAPIVESVRLLLEGKVDHEFRTTVVSPLHDRDSFVKISELIRGAKRYFLQPFADRDTVPFRGLGAPTKEELNEFAEAVRPYVENVEIRGV